MKLEKSVMIRRVRWHLIASYALGCSILLNLIQYAGSFKEQDSGPRYYHEYVASDFERERLATQGAGSHAPLACQDDCHAATAPVADPIPAVPFDAVDPQSVYYGCLDLMSRMGPFWNGKAPNHAREYVLGTCAEAAEWSANHPGAPNAVFYLLGR